MSKNTSRVSIRYMSFFVYFLYIHVFFFYDAVSVLVLVVSSVVVFLVGVVGGSAAGALLVYFCYVRNKLKRPHPPPPEAQLYEQVGITTARKQQGTLKLGENMAYGHFHQ